MTDPTVELYIATLSEVQRQSAVHLGSASDATAGGGGAASDSNGWVVLESQSTTAQLPGETGCSVWPQQQWQIAYEILFCQCPPSIARLRPHQADDLLFFALTDEAAVLARTRLIVRRRQAKQAALPPDLAAATEEPGGAPAAAAASSKAAQVDWRASVLLMVVLQSAYRLSVVTAEDAELLSAFVDGPPGGTGGGGGTSTQPAASGAASAVHQVTKVVHASPSHVPVNLDNSRSDEGRPQSSYPDICFAVDTCDDAFQSQVLRQPADCYCVLLHADVSASWRLPAARAASTAGSDGGGAEAAGTADAAAAQLAGLTLSRQQAGGSQPRRSSSRSSSSGSTWLSARSDARAEQATVFSGYVSHKQLTAALGSQLAGDPVRQVLRAAAAAARGEQQAQQREAQPLATTRVTMRGPAGRGAADVAVSSYAPPGVGGAVPAGQQPAAGGGRLGLFGRAALLVRGMAAAAKQAAGPKEGGTASVEQLHLRCALMTLQVPVEMLADSILRALQQ